MANPWGHEPTVPNRSHLLKHSLSGVVVLWRPVVDKRFACNRHELKWRFLNSFASIETFAACIFILTKYLLALSRSCNLLLSLMPNTTVQYVLHATCPCRLKNPRFFSRPLGRAGCSCQNRFWSSFHNS